MHAVSGGLGQEQKGLSETVSGDAFRQAEGGIRLDVLTAERYGL